MSRSGERFSLWFAGPWIGQSPKFAVLHFPSLLSSLESWVINYQQKCEPCQCRLWLSVGSPCSTELRSRFSLSLSLASQLHLLSSRAPPIALRSFFIYEYIQLNCVGKRMRQPLPCQCIGTTMLKTPLISQEQSRKSDPSRSHLWFPPAGICRSTLPSAKGVHLGDGVTTPSLHRH